MSQRQRNDDEIDCRIQEDEDVPDAIIKTSFSVLYIYNLSKGGESKTIVN